jgi:hypothetical protein
MGNTHSGKPLKSLEKPGFPGIPGKLSSLNFLMSSPEDVSKCEIVHFIKWVQGSLFNTYITL